MKNETEIKHIESGNLISRKSTQSYSNDRLIIADFQLAEFFHRELLDELLNTKNKILKKGLRIILQPVDEEIKEITPVENAVYQDFASFIGANELYICNHQRKLSDNEVLAFWKS